MYRDTTELTRDEMVELKQNFLLQLADDGVYAEVMDVEWDSPSWGEMAIADELVDDEVIHTHYSGTVFVEEDFWCNLKETEER